MDFESPDVAKEFPGLYMGDLEVGMKNEDDEEQDKSKKKKDKKKDKEKGYAALAGESSHDEEDDAKSPGKSKKIKAFKLTSSKKKDKDKEKEPKPLDMQLQGSSILRTGSIREKRPFDREKKPSEKELRKSAEKEVKRQMSPATSSAANPRLSLPTSATTKVTHPPPERTHSLTKNLTLNAFLNAPAPLLKKKITSANSKDKDKESVKKDKEKNHKKDEAKEAKDKGKELIPSLVRLKLKRGSKNSLEDSQSDSPVAPSHQFPESPDAIAKEIRRYEILLEQTHAQIKSSKKVSKKSEEQLWELQRTLTQLKRKLRSVNALSSASSANIVLSHSTSEKSAKDSEKSPVTSSIATSVPQTISKAPASANASIPNPNPISSERNVIGASLSPKPHSSGSSTSDVPILEQQQPKLTSPVNQVSPATTITKIEPSSSTSLPLPDGSRRISMHLDTSVDSIEESQSQSNLRASENKKESTESSKKIELSKSPGATSLEKVQVHVQVHNNAAVAREIILTPEDVFEKEIESFDAKDGVEPTRNCPSPIIMGEYPTVGSSAKSEASLEDSAYEDDSEKASIDGDPLDDRDYPEIPEVEAKPLIDRSEESPDDFVPAFIVEESDDDFDPFRLPIFQTDEFIAHENEALIGFNQKLQDEIVKEEERITSLMDEYKYLTDAGYKKNALEDLKGLDDDELAELWYSRKMENEALHDKVSNLRKKVVTEILAEFRLETRLHYLQEIAGTTTNLETSPVQIQSDT